MGMCCTSLQEKILELMKAVDEFIPLQPRDLDKPFLMPVWGINEEESESEREVDKPFLMPVGCLCARERGAK